MTPASFTPSVHTALPGISIRDIRVATGLLFAAGALSILALHAAPDPDPSDQPALLCVGLVYSVVGIALLVWRSAPDGAISGALTAGILGISLCVGIARPLAMTPLFYAWPMLLSAYALPRTHLAINCAAMVGSLALALGLLAEPANRAGVFVATTIINLVCVIIVLRLRGMVESLIERLHQSSTRDGLTGALNRRALEDHMALAQRAALRAGAPFSIAVFDLDHFKLVNDRFGHGAGDRVLRRFACLVQQRCRTTDVLGRLGGEEFALVLPGTDIAGARSLCEEIRRDLAVSHSSREPAVTVSIGVASSLGEAPASLLHAADAALYHAKRNGRNRVESAPSPVRVLTPLPPGSPWPMTGRSDPA